MKKSRAITLTVLGTLTLSGCDNGADTRNIYKTLEDCVADYSPAECKEQPGSGNSGGATHWSGPGYRWGSSSIDAGNPGPGRAHRALMTESVSRGGFGSIGHFFSGGG